MLEKPQNARIVYDARWNGPHGIGRFLANMVDRIPMTPLDVAGPSTSILGPIRISSRLRTLGDYGLFYSPGFMPPWPKPSRPYVLTLHDLNHIDLPYNSNPIKRLFYSGVLQPACRQAAAIFTVSEFSRRRIQEWVGVPEEKVHNVGNGVSNSFNPDGPRYANSAPYFLAVGLRKHHKNHEGVIRAFASCRTSSAIHMLFTGEPTTDLLQLIESAAVQTRVRFLGRVGEERLIELYRGARALVFPSLYEGFGLPVIEAMACGCPVITSSTTALPEVAGEAAILVDPEDTEAIADAMTSIAEDSSVRTFYAKAGIERARRFNWDDVAARMQVVFNEILTKGA